MKKIMKILAIIGGSLCLLFILALRQLETSVANKVNETVNRWQADSDEAPAFAVFLNKQEENSLPAPIELKTVKPGGCLLRACWQSDSLIVRPDGLSAYTLKDIRVEMPLAWPLHLTIQTAPDSDIVINADIGQTQWNIRNIRGQIGTLSFDMVGTMDTQAETGEIVIHTRGLKTFLAAWDDIPAWFSLIISDTPQTFTLVPKDGAIRYQGIPLFYYGDDTHR